MSPISRRILAAVASVSAVAYVTCSRYGDDGSYFMRKLLESLPLHTSSHHKDLFPLDNNDYMGLFFVIIGLMIAAAGGIGGGGIIVPLLIIVFGFEPKFAIPLSNFTILGCSLMNVYLNMKKRHPNVDRPLVDWDLIMVMEPLTVCLFIDSFLSTRKIVKE
jgi:hypothetical protein